MNIDIVGRIRPAIRGEGPQTLDIDGQNRMTDRPGGAYLSFQQLHRQDTSNYDLYKQSVDPLVDLCLAGFNTCLLLVGESGSGKSYTLAGEGVSKSGIVPLILDSLFVKLEKADRHNLESHPTYKELSMEVYEVYNELVRDLMQVPGIKPDYLEVKDTATDGVVVMGGKATSISNASEGLTVFRQAWARRISQQTDYGPAINFTSILIHIDIIRRVGQNPLPNRSRFTIALTPGAEKLSEDSSQIRLREGPTMSKSIVSLSQLVASLANQPYPDRVIKYTESKLTHLLREEIGGNCKTRVIVCVRPQSSPAVLGPLLRLAGQFTQVKNFPILNDSFAQQMLTQDRARVIHLQQQLGLGAGIPQHSHLHDVSEELHRVQTENLQLRDRNERLHQKMEQLQGKFGSLATTKSDLSSQLLMSEEEKLKVSKTLVEMQIENNKIKEESEASKFELTNKILQLENELTELELQKEKFAQAARGAKAQLEEVERDRKDLADEYIALKTSHLALTKAHEREAAKSEELSLELINLVNAKAAMMRQMETMEKLADATAEVDRVHAMVSRLSSHRPSDFKGTREDRDNIERSIFGDERRFKNEMDQIRGHYDEGQKKLQQKIGKLTRDLNDARNQARERQKKVAELNAQVILLTDARDTLQSQNNRMQHKLKDINDDFRSRLIKYVGDIAEYVDHGTGGQVNNKSAEQIKDYVRDMVEDLKKAHRVREEQLSSAAQSYRQRLDKIVRKHEELLVTYRDLRQQVEAKGFDDLDLGPDEAKLQLTDTELHSAQVKEINRLRDDLNQALSDLDAMKIRMRLGRMSPDKMPAEPLTKRDVEKGDMASLRKQLRDFTVNTQQELEQERAALLTKNAMLEEEVSQYKSYIDNHLARYKEEIVRLRRQLGMDERAGMNTPGPYNLTNSRRY